jgi:hypothetical protein
MSWTIKLKLIVLTKHYDDPLVVQRTTLRFANHYCDAYDVFEDATRRFADETIEVPWAIC